VSLLRRFVPAPLGSAALLALWLALARSMSPGQIVLGLAVALVVPSLTTSLRVKARVRRPFLLVRYIGTVVHDVLASNFLVAWGVLAWPWRQPCSSFVSIPLELRDPAALAVLAMVTTVVPGTVWSEIALDRSRLLLHVWNVNEEQVFIKRFKSRYEKPLQEIFE
jgi:multicomponent K+:H+ antiporter subunit E